MTTNLLLALVSFATCILLTPVVRSLAMRNGCYDLPGDLKIHSAPIPRVGGIALMAGILVSTLFSPVAAPRDGAVVLALVAIWAVRLFDDLKGTSPFLRLAVDFGCGALVWQLGWKLQCFSNPYMDLAATAVVLAFAINSMNLLDGMDGLALTVSCIASIGFIILFSVHATTFTSGLAWTVAAVCAAMFVYNGPPARIFIGDSGSTLLGAALAIMALDWARSEPAPQSVFVPLMFLGLPLGDACAAVIRRLRGRKSPFAGDRRHFYDLLLCQGWSVQQILAVSAVATLALVMVGVAIAREHVDSRLAAFACLVLCGFLGFQLGSFEAEPWAGSGPPRHSGQRANHEQVPLS
jgi:UDP-GlcNAc:undecaprenyl-phosphate GlcNAc-1-phosphate transferase